MPDRHAPAPSMSNIPLRESAFGGEDVINFMRYTNGKNSNSRRRGVISAKPFVSNRFGLF